MPTNEAFEPDHLSSSSNDTLVKSNNDHHQDNLGTYFSDEKIIIPDREGFSFHKLWKFTGPGFLVSISFLDPGNIEPDLQSGVVAKYKLLWVLLVSIMAGLFLQRLSARLGVVSGHHLAEMCYKEYRAIPRLILWIMTEIAIIGSDMQEVIGTSIAIYLLSSKVVPLWGGVLITIIDTFSFLMIDKYGLRKLEFFFGCLISVMAITFGYEYIVSAPNQLEILKGMFFPWCSHCGSTELLQAVGVIGSVINLHNLYLHSALVKSRDVDRKNASKVRDANMYFLIEASVAVLVAFLINMFVVAVFAHGLFGHKNREIVEFCKNHTLYEDALKFFGPNNHPVDADLYKGGIFLGCTFGIVAMYIWAVGILAAGQSSTMTGTYAGQFAMEGFLNLQWARWKRVLITRSIAIVPTFFIAYFNSIQDLTGMNDILNALMTLQLPFAIIPTVAFTSNNVIMREFASGIGIKVIAIFLYVLILTLNIIFVEDRFSHMGWRWITLVVGVSILYIFFNIYLVIHMATYMGNQWLKNSSIMQKYVMPTENRFLIKNFNQIFEGTFKKEEKQLT